MKETLESRIILFIVIVFLFFLVGGAINVAVNALTPAVDSTVKGGLNFIVESIEEIYNK